jgi:hypothetical protein
VTPTISDSPVAGDPCSAAQNPTASDADGDGIVDGECDVCPDTPRGAAVSSHGCSRTQVDVDGDGVCSGAVDSELCPNGGNDNCPNAANVEQDDADRDGVGDAWYVVATVVDDSLEAVWCGAVCCAVVWCGVV